MKDSFIYQLILNPSNKVLTKQADPRKFARMIRSELEDVMALISSDDEMITIDGKTFNKTTAEGALVINNKLAELEAVNTQNNSFLNTVKKTEDSLRQMLG